jgi:chemotaxis protein methyltransferase CheR
MTDLTPHHLAVPDEFQAVLDLVRTSRGFDAAGYCPAVLETRIQSRMAASGIAGYGDYLRLLATAPAELDLLLESLTIKVSSFFRDPLAFEYLNVFVLPSLLAGKAATGDGSLRVWSAACANGEEPYSVAILLHELARHDVTAAEAILFATDIDPKALSQAHAALYPAASLANVRHGLLESAFTPEGESFRVRPAIARRVRFSVHDMLDRRSVAPAESVFGTFDLVLCRNLLIYFQPDYQEFICEKLYRSLAGGGYLLLGSTEILPEPWSGRFRRVTDCCPLYRKPGRAGGGRGSSYR